MSTRSPACPALHRRAIATLGPCLLGLLGLVAACSDDDGSGTLYQRLGEEPGLRSVAHDLVGRLKGDLKINSHFRNKTVDMDRFERCLVRQLGKTTGGPQTYPDPPGTPNGCRDMAAAHRGRKIAAQDQSDFLGHLDAALRAAGASDADITAVRAALAPDQSGIVEDPGNNATLYQRLGRRPKIEQIVDDFEARLAADDDVSGFFKDIKINTRLRTCFIRFVCDIDGPCEYGAELDEPGTETIPCRDMMSAHYGLRSPPGNPSGVPIQKTHFDATLTHLQAALQKGGASPADVTAVMNAFAPTCPDVVEVSNTCTPP